MSDPLTIPGEVAHCIAFPVMCRAVELRAAKEYLRDLLLQRTDCLSGEPLPAWPEFRDDFIREAIA